MSRLASSAFKAARGALSEFPVGLGLAGGTFLADTVGEPLARIIHDPIGREMEDISNERSYASLQRLRALQLQQLMAQNTARLAAVDKHTYYEVLAGRRLPKGAEVFGGTPRTDLMEQLAYGMSTGQYQPAPTPESEIAGLL